MRFGYRLSRLSGAVHTGGNVVFFPDGNTLYSLVGNRAWRPFNLVAHTYFIPPNEHAHPIRRLAVSRLTGGSCSRWIRAGTFSSSIYYDASSSVACV